MIVPAKKIKVLIAAGGTGGHVFPGIAVAEEVRALDPAAQITFAGTERGLEATILPRRGWRLLLLSSRSIKDRGALGKAIACAALPLHVLHAMALIIAEKPSVLVSIGGYAAGPLAIAAWIARVPVAVVEPNAVPGMTNRIIGRLARRVFVSHGEAARWFGAGKAVVAGTPIRREVAATQPAQGRGERRTVFVFGGSQGARRLNEAMVAALRPLGELGKRMRVIHQTGGSAEPAEISRAYAEAGVEAEVFQFTDRIWDCYSKADIVVARSGANTIAELAALGLPSILVPYPYAADDHQRANAMSLVRAGAAAMIMDSECTGERLAREIAGIVSAPGRLDAMAAAAKGAGRPMAARAIAEECLRMAGRG
jgi:UDP-N-acetylglucosamine--N-acetylmuramyl-(pentapeptide) pyrophosphoryl-undecaprenol N-acetylglucosamine transferase